MATQSASSQVAEGKWTRHIERGAAVLATIIAAVSAWLARESAEASATASETQLEETRYQAVYMHQLELWKTIQDNGDLAPFMIGGRDYGPGLWADRKTDATLTPRKVGREEADRAQLKAAIAHSLDFYSFIFVEQVPRDEEDKLPPLPLLVADAAPEGFDEEYWDGWQTWVRTIADGFEGSPGMCWLLFKESPGAYAGSFRSAVREARLCAGRGA